MSKQVLLTKLACFNLAAMFYAVNLLKSGVVIYLAWSRMLFSTSLIFVLKTVIVTKLLVLGILLSTSLIFVLGTVAVTKPLASGIFYQHLQFFSLNFVYLCPIDLCELK